jgi:uncharacterized protein (TIGR02646 family)
VIELVKGPVPTWLMTNRVEKTAQYKAAAAAGSKLAPWRASEVVAALKQECSKKCMYCECVIDDASYSAVEHIRPKDIFDDLVLEWNNLGLACPRCNTNKGSYWTEDPTLQLLNPYEDSLDEHIAFRGPLTVAILDSSRGRNTLRKLKLHSREDLLISRMRRIENLEDKLKIWHDETNAERKALYAEDVSAAIADNREFSGVLRAYAGESGFPIA